MTTSEQDVSTHDIPLIALVGRPNVGKSTLFNRLVGQRSALVHDQPGVTRDRVFGETVRSGKQYQVVDTGGLDFQAVSRDNPVLVGIRAQAEIAIEEADLVLMVLDGRAGAQPDDALAIQLLRRAGKPFIGVANKLDVPDIDTQAADLYSLGLPQLVCLSAEHGRGFGDLLDAIAAALPNAPEAPEHDSDNDVAVPQDLAADDDAPADPTRKPPSVSKWDGGRIRLAIVGRPNAGKSTLANTLLGKERFIVSDMAGTTRDSAAASVTVDDQEYMFVDTAGMRKKRAISDDLEHFSVVAAVRALDKADVAILVIDAQDGVGEQDAKIAALVNKRGKGLVIVANKWDLVRGEEAKQEMAANIRERLSFVAFAPLFRVSAKNRKGCTRIFAAASDCQRERNRRVSTGELNRFFREVVTANPPPRHKGHRPKLFYVTQPMVGPPTFVFMVRHAASLRESYRRFLQNAVRDYYGFGGTPVWLKFRERPH